MKVLTIKWQRLLTDKGGKTCPRCSSTEKEIEKAVRILKQSLAPLGIEVILQKKALAPSAFNKDVLESNRIWIDDRPLEEWLSADVGQSLCCDVCDNAECRTIEVGNKTHETIPAHLIIKAVRAAASSMDNEKPNKPSRKDSRSRKFPSGTCCR
jgi:hypothetical protein